MKTLLFSLSFFLSLAAFGQDWAPDFDSAQSTARQEGKGIVLVFSGSDWCAPCIKLDREIWQDKSFQSDAGKEFVFYRADFPRRKENQLSESLQTSNNALAEQYNERGSFPLVVVLSPDGKVVGQTGYQKITPQEYLAVLEGFSK